MYGQGGGFNPHFRHAAPLPPPPPLSQQPLPPPPPPPQQPQAGVTDGFHQQALPPPPPLAQYPQPPAMRPPPGPYQHGMQPHQNQAYPYAHLGQMHHMPMLPQQRGFGHMPMPGPPPPQAMYQQPPPQYPMPGSLPPPPPRPPSIAPENLPPPPPLPPSSPPLMPPSPPAPPATAQSSAEPEGKDGAPDGGYDGKSEEAATDLIVSDDSDMDMDGDEESPSRVHLSIANSSPAAAAECSGDINAVDVPKTVNDMPSLGSDLPPGSTGKSKTGNVTVEARSQLQLIQQGYASDDSEDEEHTGASRNIVLLPEDNGPSQPSDMNTKIGHQQVTNAEENVNAEQNNEPTIHEFKDERNPIKHSSDELEHSVKESLSGSESVGMQRSERQGRIQTKRTRNQSPQARRSCSPSGENRHTPSQSSSPGRQIRSPLAKRANLQQSKSLHQECSLPGQPLLPSSEFPQMQFQSNAMPQANDFLQNQIRSYPAQDLSHPRPLDFHPHTLQPPVVPSQQQSAAFRSDEFKRPFPLDSAPVPLPDGRPEFSGGVGLSYSSHQSSYGHQQPPPGSLASGANTVYPSFQIFPPNLPGSSDLGLVSVSDTVLPKSSIKPHYNPFASTFETDPTLDIGPVLSPNAVESASAKAVEHINALSPFGQSVPGSVTRFNESSAEVVPNRQKQSYPGFASRDPYDPLLDSIEPSSNSINKMDLGQEANLSATGSRNASKLVNIEVESKNMHGLGLVAESEVGEIGEVAADTETGVVENVSPEPLGAKDWSSDIPGDIDNDQSLDVSKKSKDSRSMKLFKVAIADFVKEVLKPSWRQGNMSREAYKMIVKKTVDKVSSAVPSNHIPKTPAKIKQYVQSSQRKVTKLVMGYVDKYVKL